MTGCQRAGVGLDQFAPAHGTHLLVTSAKPASKFLEGHRGPDTVLDRTFPLQMKQRGVEFRLVISGTAPVAEPDRR